MPERAGAPGSRAASPPAAGKHGRGLSLLRPAAAALAAVALLSALLELPSSVRAAAARAEGVGELTRTQRDLAPAYAADLDPALLLRARELLPPDATYHVAVGEAFAAHDVTREAAAPLAAYWLLPRRQLTDPAAAEWILAYGVPLERLPVTGTVLAEPAEGQLLVRVRR